MKKAAAIIPARFGSTRFPGKALKNLHGKPVILHVAEKASLCKTVGKVIVATDDNRILETVQSAGFTAKLTGREHRSGTDRIAEVAREIEEEIVVNIQGDEPMIDPESVDLAVNELLRDENLMVSTLRVPIGEEEYKNPNAVKVVTDKNSMALYFSRAPIPYHRSGLEKMRVFKHLGIYVYRREFLLEFAGMEPTELEMAEKLEQLRILENGIGIKVVTAKMDSIGIDTPEDLAKAEELMNV